MTTWRKVLAWETESEDPYGEIRKQPWEQRTQSIKQLLQEIQQAKDADDQAVQRYRLEWYGSAYGTSYLDARNNDEAEFLQDMGADQGFTSEASDGDWEISRIVNVETEEVIYEN